MIRKIIGWILIVIFGSFWLILTGLGLYLFFTSLKDKSWIDIIVPVVLIATFLLLLLGITLVNPKQKSC